ncbi:hypothetical protein [Alkalibacterium olivapovliticus]|uniref:hypothetical protein n=1 Tax=Alkalibacterium olivapovliticus TaxID=99907 RepID=UPI000D058217|nr:hypothetical protein [Alkalibacterium olivapovliticus]
MWLKRNNQSDGYVLLEALISISLLMLVLAGTVPFFIDIFEVRQLAKKDVELSRFLYESALFWEMKETVEQVSSGTRKAEATGSSNRIYIRGEDGNETEVELLSIKWSE